jgi:predicted RNA methylase
MPANMKALISEQELAAVALALGAEKVRGLSVAEASLIRNLPDAPRAVVRDVERGTVARRDPLGEMFCKVRSPAIRRPRGATYTPAKVIRAMLRWAGSFATPDRVVDAGAGSGRFLVTAARRFPRATLLGIELDPMAALLARANLASAGLADRAEIFVADYREFVLAPCDGRTLFIGNPPYVRHHLIEQDWKTWFVQTARTLGLEASQLAGLHVHFFLATVVKAQPGDVGCFITAAEWLDVNYGRLLRELFLKHLGGLSINIIEPTAQPFPDAATTATITCFEIGARPRSIRLKRFATLDCLGGLHEGRSIRRERLEAASRWTPLSRPARRGPQGYVELGELCRVHRGQVTGANKIWIAGPHSAGLPDSVLFPAVTKARELFQTDGVLRDPTPLRKVIDLPVDLSVFASEERRHVEAFLKVAKSMGADKGYIARNRKAWWAVELREPAPILASYMARRAPAFVRNLTDARHLNIAHGIYPREPLDDVQLRALAGHLAAGVSVAEGRTYAGGLTKFEPREMERLLVPDLPSLTRLAQDQQLA